MKPHILTPYEIQSAWALQHGPRAFAVAAFRLRAWAWFKGKRVVEKE